MRRSRRTAAALEQSLAQPGYIVLTDPERGDVGTALDYLAHQPGGISDELIALRQDCLIAND
jgi:hypothetical protein